jgi:hypothetical protein
MKTLALAFSTALCMAALPVFAGGATVPDGSFTLAQDVTIGPNGIGIGERDHDRIRDRDHDRIRDRDHDRVRARLGDRDSDRGCRTVTVQERGETRTTRRCD